MTRRDRWWLIGGLAWWVAGLALGVGVGLTLSYGLRAAAHATRAHLLVP